jgi:hypothetical protein
MSDIVELKPKGNSECLTYHSGDLSEGNVRRRAADALDYIKKVLTSTGNLPDEPGDTPETRRLKQIDFMLLLAVERAEGSHRLRRRRMLEGAKDVLKLFESK